MTGIIILAIVVIVAFWLIGMYNGFIKSRNIVEEAFSTMDVYMKKRFDLIPNVVETVKGYAAHEKETLEKVIQARNAAMGATTTDERIKSEGQLTQTLRSLFAVAEAYPDLKANTNFTNLQNQLAVIEGEIANSRKYYNACVKEFNTKIEVFPGNIIAGMFGFKKFPMFEVDNPEERQNVQVKF